MVVEHFTLPGDGEKTAASIAECNPILERIKNENPSYWPYGLTVEQHHDIYVIRDAATMKAAGFVGWQQFEEPPDNQVVGYYTIGVLPEYRGLGMAKKAVRNIIDIKRGQVDRVAAFIVPGNAPSEGLAKSLGVPVVR